MRSLCNTPGQIAMSREPLHAIVDAGKNRHDATSIPVLFLRASRRASLRFAYGLATVRHCDDLQQRIIDCRDASTTMIYI